MKLGELANLIEAKVSGNPEVEITRAASFSEAGEGEITFLREKKEVSSLLQTRASAVIVADEVFHAAMKAGDVHTSLVVSADPQFSFARVLEILYGIPYRPTGISDRAVIGAKARIGIDVSIHPFALIGDNAKIGDRVTVSSGVFIGEGVTIGDNSCIHPNVTIGKGSMIGARVFIHAGSVIGSDGFGYVMKEGRHYKVPQVGGVIIEDDVEIGANVTIDRATVGNTIIGSGSKIDNLVQIGHNVIIGKHCIIVSQVGISGSVEIGDGVILAGQAGVRDHVTIGSRAVIAAQSGVGGDIPAGEVYSGSPAIPHRTWLRAQSVYAKLPEYLRRLQEIERKISKEGASDVE